MTKIKTRIHTAFPKENVLTFRKGVRTRKLKRKIQKGGNIEDEKRIQEILPTTTILAAQSQNIFTTPVFNFKVVEKEDLKEYKKYSMNVNDTRVNAFYLVDSKNCYIVLNAGFWSYKYIPANDYIKLDISNTEITVLKDATIEDNTIMLTINPVNFLESKTDQDSKELVSRIKKFESDKLIVSEVKNTLMVEGFFASCSIM
jgi:hypothetical protein